uniref:START domain-containing protein n=1 Tax=Romanomermis culicivorax TaxID=13658 RepID=A0A915KCJ1_ROMCU
MSLPYKRLGRHLNQNFRQYFPQNPSNSLANLILNEFEFFRILNSCLHLRHMSLPYARLGRNLNQNFQKLCEKMSLPYTRLGRHLNQNFRQYLPQNPSNSLANLILNEFEFFRILNSNFFKKMYRFAEKFPKKMSLPYTRLGRHLNQNFRQYLPQNPSNCLANVFRVSSLVVQCNSYSSLNARRLARILQFYKKLYNQKSVYGLLQKLSTNFPSITKSFRNFKKFFVKSGTLLSASIFSFKSHGIADEDMIEVASSCVEKQADTVSDEENLHNFYAKSTKLLNAKNSLLRHEDLEHWELVSEKENFSIWRRKRLFSTSSQDDEQSTSNSGALYEYKCAGRYTDVPAYGFLIAQMDLEYRKKWDHLVVCLDVLECDSATGSEVIRWVTHFPYPMCPREYVYVRRACLDPVAKCIILTSKNVVNHPKCPRQDQKYVRVEEYFSSMIIKPHDDFSKILIEFFADLIEFLFFWKKKSVPNFVQKVYKAAKALPFDEKNVEDLDNYSNSIKTNRRRLDEISSTKIPLTTNKTFDLPILKRRKMEKLSKSTSTDFDDGRPTFPPTEKSSAAFLTDNNSCLLYDSLLDFGKSNLAPPEN